MKPSRVERSGSNDEETGLYFEECGIGDPILLIHGIGVSSYTWRHLVGPLSMGRTVIQVDLKGFGRSPKPKGKQYSIQDQAEILSTFIASRRLEGLSLIGHSLGGAIALTLATSASAEIGRIKSLILIDSAGFKQDLPFFLKALRTPIINRLALRLVGKRANVRTALRTAYYDRKGISKDQVTEYAKDLSSRAGRKALINTARQLFDGDIEGITSRFRSIEIPTLLIWGNEDRIIPLSIGRRLHREIPNSRLIVLDKCGHMPQEEAPERVLTAIESFL